MKQLLFLVGGGGTEHAISLRSAEYLKKQLEQLGEYDIHQIEILGPRKWKDEQGELCALNSYGQLERKNTPPLSIDLVIPCLHGIPGETGHIMALLELFDIPFLGSEFEPSAHCWNKITTKMWMEALGIPNTPSVFLSSPILTEKAKQFFEQHGEVFVKASNQGSSVAVFKVSHLEELKIRVKEAFEYSPFVLIEKSLSHLRELEVAAYECEGKLHLTAPGEIILPEKTWYDYQQKYDSSSKTRTQVPALNIPSEDIEKIKSYARKLFEGLKLRHLARIDFFYGPGEIYLNEPNTFPGLTSISLFPLLLENNGHSFKEWLRESLHDALQRKSHGLHN